MPSPDRRQRVDEWQPHDLVVNTGSSTPPRPTWSPVTPTLSQIHLPSNITGEAEQSHHYQDQPQPQWIEEPEPLPVSLDENPDAIALRAAISILELQRQQSLRDIKTLDRMKKVALSEPEAFVKHLKAGDLRGPPSAGVEVDDVDDDDDDNDDAQHDVDNSPSNAVDEGKFTKFPRAQNVVRCPPINWDKYHIVGESLDRLHEEQKTHPGITDTEIELSGRAPAHIIAAPYRPFMDQVDHSSTAGYMRR